MCMKKIFLNPQKQVDNCLFGHVLVKILKTLGDSGSGLEAYGPECRPSS